MDLLYRLLTGKMQSPLPPETDLQDKNRLSIANYVQKKKLPFLGEEVLPRKQAQAQVKGMAAPIPTSTPVPNPQDFWDEFTNLIRIKAGERGYNPDVLIRQKALESGFGTSQYARERNNFGGVGAYDSNPDNAFSYESPEDYLEAYFKLIENRYPEAYKNRANPQRYVEGLKKGGYASDPEYVWKVLNTPLNR